MELESIERDDFVGSLAKCQNFAVNNKLHDKMSNGECFIRVY